MGLCRRGTTRLQMTEPRRIVLFGLPFSPNVGDGVIADCLAYALVQQMPGVTIQTIDLAGRTGPGKGLVRRGPALFLLGHLSPGLRQHVVAFALRRLLRRLGPDWTHAVKGADFVLFGGGQILSDVDLNFPLKLDAAARIATAAGVPMGIVAAGVAANWSARGAALFATLGQGDLRHVALRDAGSIAHWTAQMPQAGLPVPVLCRDPGLLAAQCYGLAGPDGRGQPSPDDAPVGVGIADPAELALHADMGIGDRVGLMGFYADLVLALGQRGTRVRLFCNGADDDAAFMEQLFLSPRLTALRHAGLVEMAPRPATGAELAQIIAGCHAVVAHRLHACIVAYTLGRPFVGLAWDSKLDGFLQSVGLQDRLGDAAEGAESVVRQLDQAITCGISPVESDRVRAECRTQIASVLAAFGWS